MKPHAMARAALLPLLLAGGAATAQEASGPQEGTLAFTGTVLAQTCVIANKTQTVVLPVVPVSELARNKEAGGRTRFAINLTNCRRYPGEVSVEFDSSSAPITPQGWLANQGSAQGVALKLFISNHRGPQWTMDLRKPHFARGPLLGNLRNTTGVAGTTIPHHVAYVGTSDTITPGDVRASIRIKVRYR